jgi:hypothetical protein
MTDPQPTHPTGAEPAAEPPLFSTLPLDPKLLRAVADSGYTPTIRYAKEAYAAYVKDLSDRLCEAQKVRKLFGSAARHGY